ncbi:saccharopine dehydrogenase [Streptomyces sp. NPDC002490]|uniref:saccharopine dehydrogenase n=1 Tax=Streptomyces sp. NPDC002490 TaxID=3154416 RepID=UPI0033199112
MNSGVAGRILVPGGYGAVGEEVTATLERWFPGRVVPGGRSAERARRHGGVQVDVTDPRGFERVLDHLGDVAVVVLCVEPPDASVARICLERGIHLVDVGADADLLAAVEGLRETAVHTRAAAVLSVGVAPGLTNLLARRAHEEVGGAERIDVTVLLGSGERHGADAVRWTVAHLAAPTAGRRLRTSLPGFGRRTAHPFPFSDQHASARTLGVPRVTTRLCLDSRLLTALLFGARATGLLRLAARPGPGRLLTSLFGRVHPGGDAFAVRVDAHRGGRRVGYAVRGHRQSRFTALVAAHTARHLLHAPWPLGVVHLDEIAELSDLPDRLASAGLTLHRLVDGASR